MQQLFTIFRQPPLPLLQSKCFVVLSERVMIYRVENNCNKTSKHVKRKLAGGGTRSLHQFKGVTGGIPISILKDSNQPFTDI